MKYEHEHAEAFIEWFMAGTTTHLETLKESLRSQNVPTEHWSDVYGRLTGRLSEALDAMRQQIREGTSRSRPADYVRVDDSSYRLLQQKQQIVENEIGARRQQQSGSSRR